MPIKKKNLEGENLQISLGTWHYYYTINFFVLAPMAHPPALSTHPYPACTVVSYN